MKFRYKSALKSMNSSEIMINLAEIGKKLANILAIFKQTNELRERCKGVHFVDLGESFPTHIHLQNLASIQPRTSPSKLDTEVVR